MKDASAGSERAGQSALELLIALGVLVFVSSAAIIVAFGGQSLTVDTETNTEGLRIAGGLLEETRATAAGDFLSVISTSSDAAVLAMTYHAAITVSDISSCSKQVTSTVTWLRDARAQRVDLSTRIVDLAGAVAIGGDCAAEPPDSDWDNPQTFASSNINPGKPTSIDSLNKIVYIGGDKVPFLYIADTRNAVLGQSNGMFVTFANGFTVGTTVNDVDVMAWQDPVSGAVKRYAYIVMNSSTEQVGVVDVTDIENPVMVTTRSLSSCVTGSYPEGWRVVYHADRLYVTTRETAGPEFHVFDVSDPIDPVELGSGSCLGTNLGTTVNSMAVRDQVVGGVTKRFAYLATSADSMELRVLDVTDPLAIDGAGIPAANKNLSGGQNGQDVYLVGNMLYFGRASVPSGGPDLHVFNVADPYAGIPQIAAQDIGTGVSGIVVAGKFAFLGTPKANAELQIWNVADISNMSWIVSFNFPQMIENGLDYEHDFVYATAEGNDTLRIIYSP